MPNPMFVENHTLDMFIKVKGTKGSSTYVNSSIAWVLPWGEYVSFKITMTPPDYYLEI